jgi:hypothetical protein
MMDAAERHVDTLTWLKEHGPHPTNIEMCLHQSSLLLDHNDWFLNDVVQSV